MESYNVFGYFNFNVNFILNQVIKLIGKIIYCKNITEKIDIIKCSNEYSKCQQYFDKFDTPIFTNIVLQNLFPELNLLFSLEYTEDEIYLNLNKKTFYTNSEIMDGYKNIYNYDIYSSVKFEIRKFIWKFDFSSLDDAVCKEYIYKNRLKHKTFVVFLKKNKDFLIELCETTAITLLLFDVFNNDVEIFEKCKNPYLLIYAHKNILKNKELLKRNIEENFEIVKYIDEKYYIDDVEIVKILVKNDWNYIKKISVDMTKHIGILKIAIKKSYLAFKYIHKSLEKNKKVIGQLIDINHNVYLLLNYKLKRENEFIIKALKSNGMILFHIPEDLKYNKKYCYIAIKNSNGHALRYIPDKHKYNKKMVNYAFDLGASWFDINVAIEDDDIFFKAIKNIDFYYSSLIDFSNKNKNWFKRLIKANIKIFDYEMLYDIYKHDLLDEEIIYYIVKYSECFNKFDEMKDYFSSEMNRFLLQISEKANFGKYMYKIFLKYKTEEIFISVLSCYYNENTKFIEHHNYDIIVNCVFK